MAKKKILLTGGAGYIGSHVTRKLLKKGYTVHLLDNFSYGWEGLNDIKDHKRLKIFEGDICNIRDMVRAIKGTDRVIALAAIVGDPACNIKKDETYSVNYESTKILVEISKFYKMKRLVFASSCSVYGASSNDMWLNEGSLLNPVSSYAVTRVLSEDIVLNNSEKVVPVVCRLATVFGASPRMRFDLVVNFLTAKGYNEGGFEIFGGDQWRPNVHCQDAADAFIKVAEAKDSLVNKEIFNVGSNKENYKITDIGKLVKKELPKTRVNIQKQKGDQRDYRVSFDKASEILGFKTKFTVQDGIREIKRLLKSKEISDYKDPVYYNVDYLYR